MHIEVISIPVTDQNAAKAFYETLGFVVAIDMPFEGTRRWLQMTMPGDSASISLVTWFETMKPGTTTGFVLHAKNFDETHAALAGRGVAISEPDRQPWGIFATVEDPDGNTLTIRGE